MQVEEPLRTLSHELRPRTLEDLGLRAALEFLADGVAKRTGTVVAMQVALGERLPPPRRDDPLPADPGGADERLPACQGDAHRRNAGT
jgi:hypothetical protein